MTTSLPMAEPAADYADASPLPLPACWAIWIVASVVLWWLVLRLLANFAT